MEEKDMNDTFNISIMHVVNTGKLWVSEPPGKDMSGQRRILQQLEENLSKLMCRTFEMPSNLPVNKLIAVKHEVTGCWHRGELLSPLPTSSSCRVRVFLVDHGAILFDVQPKHLQILPEEMHELPKQAFIVCLYGLIPVSMTVHLEDTQDKMHYEQCMYWTPASENFVKKHLKYSTSAHLRGIVCKGHVVHGEVILNIPGEGYISLNEELTKNNFAIYSEAKYEKVIEREAKLEERLIAKILEANEKEVNQPKISEEQPISEPNPTLMEDFLKEYANKKMLRLETNTQFLHSNQYRQGMRGCKVDDEKTREAIKNAIFASRVKTSGRGDNLNIMKESNPVISVGRGLPLQTEEQKISSSQMENSQMKLSSPHSLFDILSKSKSEESTSYQRDSSVLPLGRIPAGHPSQFEEFESKFKKTKAVTKKKAYYSCKRSPHGNLPMGFHDLEENTSKLSEISLGVSFDNYEFLDPEFLLESKKSPSSKSPLKEETVSNSNQSYKEIVSTAKANASPVTRGGKIMKLLLSLNSNSEEGKPGVITKDVDASLSKNSSATIPSMTSYRRPYGNDLFSKESNDISASLKSQPSMPKALVMEKSHNDAFCDAEEGNMESSKKKNPLYFLLEALRKKSKNDGDILEDEPCINPPFSRTITSVSSNITNEQPDTAGIKGYDTSLPSNDNHQSVTSFFKRSTELVKVQSPEGQTNTISIISNNLDLIDSKDNEEVKDETNTTDLVEGFSSQLEDSIPKLEDSSPEIEDFSLTIEDSRPKLEDFSSRLKDSRSKLEDSSPKLSSDPSELKAAFDLISNFITSIENKDSQKPPVDLIRLKRELNTFSQHVISKKANKLDVSGEEVSTNISNKKSDRSSKHDFHVNNENLTITNSEGDTVDCIESFDFHPVMPEMEETMVLGYNNPIKDKEGEEINVKETQESKKILLPKPIEMNCEVEEKEEIVQEIEEVVQSFKLEDSVKETLTSKYDDSPEKVKNIEENIPNERQPFSLLSFFPENKHITKGDVKVISHGKQSSSESYDEVSPGTSQSNFSNEAASEGKSFLETLLRCKAEKKLDIQEGKGAAVQVSEKDICKEIGIQEVKGVVQLSEKDICKEMDILEVKGVQSSEKDIYKDMDIQEVKGVLQLSEKDICKETDVQEVKVVQSSEKDIYKDMDIQEIKGVIHMPEKDICKEMDIQEVKVVQSSEKDIYKDMDIQEVKGVVQMSEKDICKDIGDGYEMKNETDTSVPLGKDAHEKKPLDDDHVLRNISSCSKILQEIEQVEKNKCLQIIKDEGIPMAKLSARLPTSAAQSILKSKGFSPVSSTSNDYNSSSSTSDEDSVISKQKILEPEVITPVHKDELPSLLRDAWLSGYSNDDCLFIQKRQKMCRVLVRGCFLAQRITSIAQATFPKSLHEALANMGFRDPMRIQTYTWPALMRGHDLVMVNPPRSGKTLGYLVPLLGFMLSPELYSELPDGNGPLVLIICPSWKVVSQVNEFCESLLSKINGTVKVIPTYGGIEAEQTVSLINGCHVLISTPRSFLRLLKQDRITTSLERLCHLVFDEADMLMKLFFPEVKEILRECRLILQRRAKISAESNPVEGAASYTMVKLVAASNSWCPQMESFVKNIIDKPVLLIGSYLEAAVYARLKPKLHLVGFGVNKEGREEEKVHLSENINVEIDDIVLYIIKRRVGLYKIVVACESKKEALQLAPKISDLGARVLVIHENVLHVDIAETLDAWTYSKQPGAYPVLIVTDGALPEVNIGDAEHLIHVGIPSISKTQFGLRFSTLMDNYRDILDKSPDATKSGKSCFVDIIVDMNKPDIELSGLIEFMQRLGMEIPKELEAAATKSLLNKEMLKKRDIELCPNLKSSGECSSAFCNFRHVISPELDKPKGVPLSGEVCVKILHVLDASHMSVRLLEHFDDNGGKTIYPNDYYVIAAQMARYFGKSQNQVAHGNPKVGDLCAYEIEVDLFHRARVEKVFYSDSKVRMPVGVNIKLIDMGINVKARVFQLFYLPDSMKEYPEQAKELIVANMLPRDLDSSWSKAACVKVAEWIEEGSRGESNGKIIVGKIVLALGNTIWVDPLECREWLINNKTNVIHLSLPLNLCQVGLAIKNPEHIKKIKQICEVAGMPLKSETSLKEEVSEGDALIDEMESPNIKLESDVKVPTEWETLDHDNIIEVHVVDVESPSCFTVQKVDAEEKLKDLMDEIQSWISDVWQKSPSSNGDNIREYSTNSFCLGYFERDKCWNRAKVLSVLKTSSSVITDCSMDSEVTEVEQDKLMQYQLYFLDFGDSVTVSSSEIAPIPENFISKLPFQAIECSLFGVKPSNKMSDNDSWNDSVEGWNEEAGDAFYALCREGDDLDIYRNLLAKVLGSAEGGAFGGSKYSVALYDKGGSEGPISLSKLLIEKGFAASCRTESGNEMENEEAVETEELASHWLGEGALLPFTHSLDLSTASEIESETLSCEDSNGAFTSTAKKANPSLSESTPLSSYKEDDDDDDDDSYDIVMSDDELKMYEQRLRTFLGIPHRPDEIKKTEEQCLAIEAAATIEETSSYGMLTPNEDHSSFTSFEDLGDYYQQTNDRFEEILDENPEDVCKPERIAEGENGNGVGHASVDVKESMEDHKCYSDLDIDVEKNLGEPCLSLKSDCRKDEEFREESSPSDAALEIDTVASRQDDISLEVESSTLISDTLSETQLGNVIALNSNSGISGKVLDVVKCSNKSDSFVRSNEELDKCLRTPVVDAKNETEINPGEIEINVRDVSAHFMVPVKADSLNVEEKSGNNEPVCDNMAVDVNFNDEIAVSANVISHISAETLVEDELTNTKDSADSLQSKHFLLSSKSSEINRLEEDGTVMTDSTVKCPIAIKEVTVQRGEDYNQVDRTNNGGKNFQLDETLKKVEERHCSDFVRISDEIENPDADSSFPVASDITTETENFSEVSKESNDYSDKIEANTSLDVTEITNENSDSSDDESCAHMPTLIKAKTPSVKWAQTKTEIILTIDVPSMTRYQVHWMTNRKLKFFALTDTDAGSRYALEIEFWGYVDSQNSQIAAISDNSVKMILPKSFTCMEWPHLFLSGIRPSWLSVDFDAMEFDTEEKCEEDSVPLVNYNESDEEYGSNEDTDSIEGHRVEEINYDPYDPLS